MIDNADLRLPSITDEEGNTVQLSNGNYGVYVRSANREVRKAAFEGVHTTFKQQQNTIAANLATQVKKNIYFARVHDYPTAIAAALDGNNIPVSVYTNLVESVSKGLPTLHRYLALRKKVLKLDEQHYYDLYAPLVAEAKVAVPYAEAREEGDRCPRPTRIAVYRDADGRPQFALGRCPREPGQTQRRV